MQVSKERKTDKMKEIYKLKEMLENAEIPFEFEAKPMCFCRMIQIYYPKIGNVKCSVIESDFSYGSEFDLLEIMGLLTPEEQEIDSVLGFLTAEEVFQRIKRNWEEMNND